MDKKQCTGCSACAAACPQNAIHMQQASDGFYYPVYDRALCTSCQQCEKVCPLSQCAPEKSNRFYALRCLDIKKRFESTSGGAFRLLAEQAIAQGAEVYGAAFDENFQVIQTTARQAGLCALLQTKYVQSFPGATFREVSSLLKEGRKVLYSGSPCTVAGLLSYLGPQTENLLTVDHVCYGAPSPGLWNAYVADLQERAHARLELFNFRDKRNKDSGHTLSYVLDGNEIVEPLNSNKWCRLYFSNINLRSSCLRCPYCTPDRLSDITIGDFWGIENSHPELDDGFGVSLVITHTHKGQSALENIFEHCSWVEVPQEHAMQPRLKEPVKAPIFRALFFRDLDAAGGAQQCDMQSLLKKYIAPSIRSIYGLNQ